jgi:hypothetical protein
VVKTSQTAPAALHFGRYALHDAIASGGMATVHLGRMATTAGVTRTVAIKRMHPHLLAEADFASMFLDEARLAMRIQHPNVVGTFDVISTDAELLLVMDFVLGESLDRLLRRARGAERSPPVRVVCSVVAGVLAGLHAAHEARDEDGRPLDIVHRDVSPQNVLVGIDGVARVVDFGVAKAAGRLHTTEQGQIKGKLAYMAPEQLTMTKVDRRADVFAAAVVLWEGLAGQRLFGADNPGATVANVLDKEIVAPSTRNAEVPAAVDAVVLRGLSRHPDLRFASAREMAVALEQACAPATPREIGEWVEGEAGEAVRARAALLARVESRSSSQASAVHDRSATVEALAARASIVGERPPAPRADADGDTLGDTLTNSSVAEAAAASLGGRGPRRRRVVMAVGSTSLLLAALVLTRISARARDVPPPNVATHPGPPLPALDDAAAATPSIMAPAPSGITLAAAPPSGETAGKRSPAPHPAAAHPSAPHKPDCRNPFTVAAGGIRVPRPECF